MKRFFTASIVLLLVVTLGGCTSTKKAQKIRDLEYTVVKEEEIPKALSEQIESRKESRFKLTYQDGEYLYIASGYGQQQTGGYSIEMKELYLTEDAIYFDTELYGPQKGETVHKAPSYPYIVVKLEIVEKPVVFQ